VAASGPTDSRVQAAPPHRVRVIVEGPDGPPCVLSRATSAEICGALRRFIARRVPVSDVADMLSSLARLAGAKRAPRRNELRPKSVTRRRAKATLKLSVTKVRASRSVK
jgi:hypothetical protein